MELSRRSLAGRDEERESREVGRQLRNIFDFDSRTSICWWRIALNDFEHHVIQFRSFDTAISVFVDFEGRFDGFKNPLFFQNRDK